MKVRAPKSNKQNGDTYFNWHAEAFKRLQDAKIASLKNLLQKANEKLKAQQVPKRAGKMNVI